MILKTDKNYIDVTNEWINKSKSFSNVIDAKYYEHNGKKYYVDNKNVVLDYSRQEIEVAELITKTFGGTIYMIPRINYPKGIKTPDYIWNNERWDLKTIHGNSKNSLYDSIKNSKEQSNNFIIDISKSKLSTLDAERQIAKIFDSSIRKWIRYIIIIKHNNIKVYKNNKRS